MGSAKYSLEYLSSSLFPFFYDKMVFTNQINTSFKLVFKYVGPANRKIFSSAGLLL